MYTPELGRWFNPDPLAEQYLSQSTYHFSGNNPMRFVDLNGMNYDDYGVDSNGNITLLNETDDNYDVLYAVDENKKKKDTTGDGKVTESDGVKVEEGKKREDRSILPKLAKKDSEYNGGRWASSKSLKDIGNVFLYAATHSNVEWAFRAFEKGGSETFVVSTSNKESSVRQITSLSIFDEKDVTIALHSHPGENDTKGASYAGGRGDWKNVIKYYGRWTKSGKDPHKFPTHGVYHRYSRTIFYYTPWNKSIKGHTFKKTKRRPYMGK
jgi:hypothetical protein